MLSISNLSVSVADKPILKGLTLDVPAGEVHAVMGPNGAGKSTLGYALAGRPNYEVTGGAASWNGESLLDLDPAERAAKGLYLSFQYPVEIPGVPTLTFVRAAMNAQRKARGEGEISAPEFIKAAKAAATALKMRCSASSWMRAQEPKAMRTSAGPAGAVRARWGTGAKRRATPFSLSR